MFVSIAFCPSDILRKDILFFFWFLEKWYNCQESQSLTVNLYDSCQYLIEVFFLYVGKTKSFETSEFRSYIFYDKRKLSPYKQSTVVFPEYPTVKSRIRIPEIQTKVDKTLPLYLCIILSINYFYCLFISTKISPLFH